MKIDQYKEYRTTFKIRATRNANTLSAEEIANALVDSFSPGISKNILFNRTQIKLGYMRGEIGLIEAMEYGLEYAEKKNLLDVKSIKN
jgi:hypothetical protein